MTTGNILSTGTEKFFSDIHYQAVQRKYDQLVERGEFSTIETDYSIGQTELKNQLSSKQLALINEMETLCKENYQYACKFGFRLGHYDSFHRLFCRRFLIEWPFESAMNQYLFTASGMAQHPLYQKNNDRCLDIQELLKAEIPESLYEHVVSVACAWEERIHFAGNYEYYLGYRSSLACAEALYPGSTNFMKAETLLLEYSLGMISDYEMLENRSELRKSQVK